MAIEASEKGAKKRRGAPLWQQLVLSVVAIIVALGVFGLVFPSANDFLAGYGVRLPLLTASADSAPAAGGRPAAAGGQGRPGGGAGARASVVAVATVVSTKINDQLSAIGEGIAVHSVTIMAPSAGTLRDIVARPGDKVVADAPLAHLDADTQQIAFDRARLAAEDADAALSRAQTLAKSNALSETQLRAAELAAQNAKLEQRNAQLALDQRTIATPIAGTVGLIQVSPGNQLSSQAVVTTVEDTSEILVNFWVPERYAAQIAVGAPVVANSVALPGHSFAGTVDAVDNRIDPASRTLQVQARLPNEDGTIRPGMSFSVALTFPGEVFTAVDPLSVQWSNDGAYVWKVVDGKVTRGMVEIIQRSSDGVLVKGDVKEGDQVVTQGVLQLNEGASVRLVDDVRQGTGA